MSDGQEPQHATTRHKLVQLVYNAIFTEVMEGRLQPSARLIQDELATAYGVSRQPAQQALLLLRTHGIVRDAPRRGFVVAPLDAEHVRDLYEVRGALDGLASRLAAERGQERARSEGPAMVEDGRLAIESGSFRRLIEADIHFHSFVSEISGNPIIVEMMLPHYNHMQRVMGEVLREDPAMPEAIWKQHNAILAAIIMGDGKRAERLARDHVARSGASFAAQLTLQQTAADVKELNRRVLR